MKRQQTVDAGEAPAPVDVRLGTRLAALRAERGWSLGELAERSGVSRSTLSRAERAEISPMAALLNRLCHVYGRTMSQLLSEVESNPRCSCGRPSSRCRRTVPPGSYGGPCRHRPPVPGLEQHIWVLEGELDVTLREVEHRLGAGDCPRMRVWGPTRFRCAGPVAVRYVLAVVLP